MISTNFVVTLRRPRNWTTYRQLPSLRNGSRRDVNFNRPIQNGECPIELDFNYGAHRFCVLLIKGRLCVRPCGFWWSNIFRALNCRTPLESSAAPAATVPCGKFKNFLKAHERSICVIFYLTCGPGQA